MFELQLHHYHLTCTKQVGWPTALWEHKLLPESGRPGNIGTQNPAGEPQSYQTLNRARFTQNMEAQGLLIRIRNLSYFMSCPYIQGYFYKLFFSYMVWPFIYSQTDFEVTKTTALENLIPG